MKNQQNSKNIIINFGLYLGAIGIITHLILFAAGGLLEYQWINSLVNFIAMVALIIIAIKKIKQANDGFISWGEGVKIGLGITMISAVIAVLYTLLFMNFIDPTFQQQTIEFQQQQWQEAGMTEEQIEGATEMTNKFQSPGIISALILAMSAFLGFVVSAIIAAIMKKTEEETY